MSVTLDKLPVGKCARITSVDGGEISLRKHILDMGLTPGTEVTLVKTAPMGDPIELRVRGYELTLRKADAAKIGISDVGIVNDDILSIGLTSLFLLLCL